MIDKLEYVIAYIMAAGAVTAPIIVIFEYIKTIVNLL